MKSQGRTRRQRYLPVALCCLPPLAAQGTRARRDPPAELPPYMSADLYNVIGLAWFGRIAATEHLKQFYFFEDSTTLNIEIIQYRRCWTLGYVLQAACTNMCAWQKPDHSLLFLYRRSSSPPCVLQRRKFSPWRIAFKYNNLLPYFNLFLNQASWMY